MGPVARVDLVDETFLAVDRARVAQVVADPARWRQWWPDLSLSVFMDRGLDGIRWSVAGALVGSCEIWLESQADGVLMHYYLRADQVTGAVDRGAPGAARRADQVRRRRALAWKRVVWELKDELEGGRRPGEPAHDART